jgi:PAS domain S-box-containing protein/diguanylate cyclase (GGDEF)-like protein
MEEATRQLRLLLVEDSPADVELLLRELRSLQRPIVHHRVASECELLSALAEFEPDVILSDYSMPGFSGLDALEIVLERAPAIPFVYVSGTLGEERAIEALQRGAYDYVLKENLRRLPAAVDRALRVAAERREREAIQRARAESEERFRAIVETSRDWIWELDREFRVTYSNPAVAGLLGYQPAELLGTSAIEYLAGDSLDEVRAKLPDISAGEPWADWRLRWRHRDGTFRIMESTGSPMRVRDEVVGFRGMTSDVTGRLRQDAKIRQLARIHAVLSAVGSSVLRSDDRERLLVNACRVAVEQGGFRAAGIARLGDDGALRVVSTFGDRAMLDVVRPEDGMSLDVGSPFRDHPSIRAFVENRIVAIEDFLLADVTEALRERMVGHGVCSQISIPLGAEPWGLLALYSNVSRKYDREEVELLQRLADEIDRAVAFIGNAERLEFLAYFDPVTGLPNRIAFLEKLDALLKEGPAAVVACDLQRFARINSSRGRAFGDALLRQVGPVLRQVRDGVFVAHAEGDAFLVAWPTEGDAEAEARYVEERLKALEQQPFMVGDEPVFVPMQAGLAIGPLQGADAETLERNAASALADAHDQGVHLRTYSDDLGQRAARRLELERDLRAAITERQFELFYQPKFDSQARRLVAAEALIRWRHPQRGLVSPAEFIPVLEDTGLVVPVGRWVMATALQAALDWRRHRPDLRIAVNISAREMRNSSFLDQCRELLEPHAGDLPLDIEVTESVLMDNVEQSVRLLQGLRALGCQVAIDDFGTGYSSLNYLARLPVDWVKIDQSFVTLLAHSPETVALVNNVISLSHSLRLQVVAEGVEEEEQAKLLRLLRCDQLQGFLLGRPVPAAEFEALIAGT